MAASFLLVIIAAFTVSGDGSSCFDLVYDDSVYSITVPLDKLLKRNVTVVNTCDNYSELEFILYYPELDRTYTGWPQPNYLYLDPGESQTIWGVLDAFFGEISSLEEGVYERTIRFVVYPLGNVSLNESVDLVNSITVVQQDNLVKDSHVCGFLYDNGTKEPLSDVKVTLLGRSATYNLEGSTRWDGFYNISCPAYNYTVKVNVSGYGDFRGMVNPPPDDGLELDIYLDKVTEEAEYSLTKTYSTDLPLWRFDVSFDERYLAVCQGHFENVGAYFPDLSEGYILNNSYIHFFDLVNESLLWKYPVQGEVWGIDVSDDGSYVAAPITNSEKVILLNGNGSLLWDTRSLGYGNVKSEEVRISGDNRYVAVGYGSGYLLLMNLSTGEELWTRFLEGQITQIVYSVDGSRIYAGSGDGYLYLFDLNGTLIWRSYVGAWPYRIQGVAVSGDGSFAASGSKLGDVCLTLGSGVNSWCYDMKGCVYWVGVSHDDGYVYAGGGGEYGTAVYDAGGSMLWYDSFLSYIGSTVTEDGREYLLTNGRPPGVCDSRGTLLWSYDLPSSVLYMTKDTSKIVAAGVDGVVYFFDGGITVSEGCDLQGDYSPCGVVSLAEVVSFINEWSGGQASLTDVIALINAWSS